MAEGKHIWRDGRLIPWDEANVHVLTHALHYGSGAFEGIRAYHTERGTAVFRLTDHMRRLRRSAEACLIPLEWSVEELCAAAKEVLAANGLDWGYLRPITFYETGGLGVLPRNVRVATMIAAWQWGAYLGDEGVLHGIRVKVSPWRRLGRAQAPLAKATGPYLNAMLAKIDAVRSGYDEAIMLSNEGPVSEGTGREHLPGRGGRGLHPAAHRRVPRRHHPGHRHDPAARRRVPGGRGGDRPGAPAPGRRDHAHRHRRRGDPGAGGRRPARGERRARPGHPPAQARFVDLVAGRPVGHDDWLEYL